MEPFDLHLFGKGEHWDAYRLLGAHPVEQEGMAGYRFAVWAPNAQEVCLATERNDWHWGELPLYPVGSSGIWAAFVPGIVKGVLYKFGIKGHDGRIVYKTDPMAFFAELRPGIAAVAWDLDNYVWNDAAWMEHRARTGPPLAEPVSMYEMHVGSWRRRHNGGHPYLSFNELADTLIPYVKDMGFTHIEFLPIAEHPLDLSWGYQTGHYYAPSSRFGTPEEFKRFVDRCHQEHIGVVLDWVPAHFPKDEWGLGRFDGTALYEHADPRLGEHPDWGTYIFNYGRNEVKNFLLANALYWLKEFHIDGLRIDAVASMLYLDYSRKEGEWCPNSHGGKENLDAIALLRELNTVVHSQHSGAMTVAEESTAWPGVSRPVYTGGLGFTFKWNMGWMHDTLAYMQENPIHRSFHHNTLTFSMLYAFTENFVLPFSHDEVVHGKGTLLSRMPGDVWQQQAGLRTLYAYMWAHPGKKLLFMGSEFGQWNEWNQDKELDWMLLDFPTHEGIRKLVRDLNWFMRNTPSMYRNDHDWSGFEWMDFADYNASVYSFIRKSKESDPVLWVFNYTPVVRHGYDVPVPFGGKWREAINTDSELYCGSNVGNYGMVEARERGHGHFVTISLPPLAGMAFVPER